MDDKTKIKTVLNGLRMPSVKADQRHDGRPLVG